MEASRKIDHSSRQGETRSSFNEKKSKPTITPAPQTNLATAKRYKKFFCFVVSMHIIAQLPVGRMAMDRGSQRIRLVWGTLDKAEGGGARRQRNERGYLKELRRLPGSGETFEAQQSVWFGLVFLKLNR